MMTTTPKNQLPNRRLVTIATLGVAFGVIFWGWGKLYGVAGLLSGTYRRDCAGRR